MAFELSWDEPAVYDIAKLLVQLSLSSIIDWGFVYKAVRGQILKAAAKQKFIIIIK